MASDRNQSFPISLPAGTGAGLQTIQVALDRKYDRADGWAVLTNTLGNATYTRIGLRDETTNIMEMTNTRFIEAGIDCPKNSRFTPVNVAADGTNLYVLVEVPVALTAALSLDVVFHLIKA